MIVYLMSYGKKVYRDTALQAYKVEKELSKGSIVNLDGKQVMIWDSKHSIPHRTTYYTYIEWNPNVIKAVKVD